MKVILKYLILFFLSVNILISQDSKDSNQITKEIRIPDSLLSMPSKTHGRIYNSLNRSFRNINKNDIQLLNYIGTSDILISKLPFYNMNLGGYSTFNSFSANGSNPKSISFSFNGRNLSDIDIGSYNPDQFPTEFFENIEIFTGSDASILGDNSSSVLINFQEIRYNTGVPFTRLWFGNAGYGYLGADGIYSQNIMPNINFTFGFRSYNSLGNFENSWGSNWNVRTILRWNPDNQTSLSLTENFSNFGSGTNGGLDYKNSTDLFDRLSAVPIFPGLNERTIRHDLTLSGSRKFDSAGSNAVSLNFYLSSVAWERSSGTFIRFDDSDTNNSVYKTNYTYFGIDGRYDFSPIDLFNLKIGGVAEFDLLDKTLYSDDFNGLSSAFYGLSTIKISDIMQVSGGVRIFSKFGNYGMAYGVKHISYFTPKLGLSLDFSYSDRLPYPVEGLNLKGEQHLSILSELNYAINDSLKITAGGYFRTVFSPITGSPVDNYISGNFINYNNGNSISRIGGYFEVQTNLIYDLTIIAKGLFQLGIDDIGNRFDDFPLFNASLKLFYSYKPGKSMLRIGVESGLLTEFKGNLFYPVHRTFYEGNYNSNFMITGLNGFAEIKLGNSFVKITYQNILNNDYYYVTVNPMFGRNFRLTASWAFTED